jgi:ABC-type molybdate transport system substrate-binding protein
VRVPILALGFLLLAGGAQAQTREINVLAPGIVANAGAREFAAAFTKETSIKVNLKGTELGLVVQEARSGDLAPDVVFLASSQLGDFEQSGARKGSAVQLGRVEIGLAVRKGEPLPDISTVAKLATAMRSAKKVVYSDPNRGSMQALMIQTLLQRPEFSGVTSGYIAGGQGAAALVGGDGDMVLQLICEIIAHPELANAGPLPPELNAYIDTAVAVSDRAAQPAAAKAFINYITQPGTFALWYSKGLIRTR